MKSVYNPSEMSLQTADKAIRPGILLTGLRPLDSLLNGGFEMGLTHLLYSDSVIRNIILRIMVQAQLQQEWGGFNSPSIIIDSVNMTNL